MSRLMELRLTMTLGYLLIWNVPAAAGCHHYSRWYYPYPQSCGAGVMRARAAEAHDWYVEFVLPDQRAAAIEILKKELAIRELSQ